MLPHVGLDVCGFCLAIGALDDGSMSDSLKLPRVFFTIGHPAKISQISPEPGERRKRARV